MIAAGLRFYNLNWDGGVFAHPDERSTVAFYAPTIQWPDDSADLFDPRASRLNPFWNVDSQERRSYTYGHFPLYTLVLAAHFLSSLQPLAQLFNLPPEWLHFLSTATSGQGYAQIGRALMGLSDLASVLLLFLMGKRMYGVWGGLLAAAFSTFTVLQIQLAHFFAVDPVSTTFTLLAIYGSMLLYERRSIGAALLTGIAMALAIASKFSALPVIFTPVLAGYLASRAAPAPGNPTAKRPMIGLVMVSLGVTFLLFAVTSPFVLLDFENFNRAVLEEQGNMVRGIADFPFTRQYRNTTAYVYFINQQIRWGMGWALGLLGVAGTMWVVVKTIRGRAHVGELLSLAWIVLYFLPTGLFLAKFMRYMAPVVPLFSLFGAGLIIALWRWKPESNSPHSGASSKLEVIVYPRPPQPPREREDVQKPSPPVRATAGRLAGGEQLQLENSEPTDSESTGHTFANDEPANNDKTEKSELEAAGANPAPKLPLAEKLTKTISILLAVIVLFSSAVWALAFVNGVYGSEHTWITFSRWMYQNVPDGSCIAYEHWDDRMPTNLPEPDAYPAAHRYNQPQLPMYDEDTQGKYELIRDTLMNCDYVVLATNRLYRTIPGLPERYPMSSRYYEALFSGALGFEQIRADETPPRLGPIVINDQPADESFTVYDHPKPILFQKTRQLSLAEWDALLGNTWQDAVHGYVGSPTLLMRLFGENRPPPPAPPQTNNDAESLLLDTPVNRLPSINDYHWNSLANNSTPAAIVVWWLAVMLIGWINTPLTLILFHKLPDRGYALNKSLGLLLVGYFVWLPGSLIGSRWLGNTLLTIFVVLTLFIFIRFAVVMKHSETIRQFNRSRRPLIISTEIVFLVVYLLFVLLRILNPDLWHPWLGGEKMLEIGFLNATVKSAAMPPYDPFFAGGIINYYYYGLFLVGTLIKLTGITPAIAFNLAIPTLAAFTAINAFSLAGNAAVTLSGKKSPAYFSPWKFMATGLLAILFIVFMGNLEGAAQFMRNLGSLSNSSFTSSVPGLETFVRASGGLVQVLGGSTLAGYNYWDPTRVIPQTINEFPFFSFLFADLHPHMIGIPFTLLLLSLAFHWLLPEERDRISEKANEQMANGEAGKPGSRGATAHTPGIIHYSQFIVIPFVLGSLAAINTWDLPTYLGLMFATFLLARYRHIQGDFDLKQIGLTLGSGILLTGLVLVLSWVFYLPFFANYHAPSETGVGWVHTKTPLDLHLKIWGFFLFVIVTWLWVSLLYSGSRNSLLRAISLGLRRWNVLPHMSQIYRRVVKRESDLFQVGLWSVTAVFVVAGLLFALGYRVPAYLFPLVMPALALLFRRKVSAATAYLNLLSFTGLLVLLGVEFVFLRDFLGGGDYYRMNTLFKFYIQVWVMFGIVVAVTLPQLWELAWQWSILKQIIWRGATIFLLLAGLVYPVFGTRTRIDDRFPGEQNRPPTGTLDGMAYMRGGIFEWPAGNPIELSYDDEAIRWLQDNVTGTPILAEAKIGYYREGGMRVAAYTGLPSILGGLHQNEQRPPAQVGQRDFVVNQFWQTPDAGQARRFIRQLGINYIYVGQIEQTTYGDTSLSKFDTLAGQGNLELVFENERTKIYRVNE